MSGRGGRFLRVAKDVICAKYVKYTRRGKIATLG
jgi:hypothetical protein